MRKLCGRLKGSIPFLVKMQQVKAFQPSLAGEHVCCGDVGMNQGIGCIPKDVAVGKTFLPPCSRRTWEEKSDWGESIMQIDRAITWCRKYSYRRTGKGLIKTGS